MEHLELGLIKKTFVLILLAVLLYSAFLISNSLAVLSDAVYALTDALFVFSLWISLVLVYRNVISPLSLKLTSLSILILSILLLFASALLLYSGFLGLLTRYPIAHPEVVIAAEILFVFVIFYVYVSLREEALKDDVRALVMISRDVERNILSSFLVMLAALFVMIGLVSLDAIVTILISSYVLYRTLILSYRSFRSLFDVSDPLLLEAIKERIEGAGARLLSYRILGVGPFYYVELTVDASHLPDRWEKVEEVLRRRIEHILPSSARVKIVSPGGGI